VNYGTPLAYVIVSVQSDILPLLPRHLVQSWTTFQQHIVDELIHASVRAL